MTLNDPAAPGSPGTGPHRTARDVAIIVAAGLLFFALNVDFTLSGDASMYADYALLAKFDELTLHIGYYAVVFVAQHTVGAAFGIPIQETMAWIAVVAGALTLGVAYLLALHFLGARRDALRCVAILAVSGRLLSNATSSEVYMLQTLLVLTSFYLFVRERVFVSGVVAGFALLVSPLSAFAYLFYPVLDYQRASTVRWKVWLRLAAGAALIYLPYLVVFGRELFWGRRGLLSISHLTPPDPMALLANFPLFQFKLYTFLVLLLIPALFAVRRERRFLALSLAVIIPHFYIILKLTSEDNVFILNTDFFFVCWLVIGWRELARSRVGKWLAPLPLAAHVIVLLVSRSIFTFDTHRGLAGEMRETARTYIAGHPAVMASNWTNTMVLTFYGRTSVTTTIERDPLHQRMYVLPLVRLANLPPLQIPEFYLLDSWEPGPLDRLFRSRALLRAQRERESSVSIGERNLSLRCVLVRETSFRLYRCTRAAASPRQASAPRPPA